MNKTNQAIEQAIAELLRGIPNPTWWSGPAATACSHSIERLVLDLRALQQRIAAGWFANG